jgi:hypothetical protein
MAYEETFFFGRGRGWKEVKRFRKIYEAPGNGTNEQMLAQKQKMLLSQHKAVL